MSRVKTVAALAALAISSVAAVAAIGGTVKAAGEILERQPSGRLIGLGCQGSSGPMYADNESAFPRCVAIEPRAGRVAWGLVVIWANGESDIVETGSLRDCFAALPAWRHAPGRVSSYCERRESGK